MPCSLLSVTCIPWNVSVVEVPFVQGVCLCLHVWDCTGVCMYRWSICWGVCMCVEIQLC